MKLIVFAQLAELFGEKELEVPNIGDTDALIAYLNGQYVGFDQAAYVIAVDRETITGKTALNRLSEIALLPPFSGG